MSGVEQRARELLAAEFDRDEITAAAGRRLRHDNETAVEAAALRVIVAALASQAQVPHGYVLVPRKPTDDMLYEATGEQVGGHCYVCSRDYATYDDAARVWAAMIAAAPAPEVDRG